ncbi:MAG: MFS transporter [Thermodesulfobacteriota bacterium]
MNLAEKNKKVRALFSFSTFHFIDDGFADSIYLLLPFIAAELQLSFSQVGILKGVFSGAMGLGQFPLSLVGEKLGELTVVASGILGLALGFLLLSLTTSFPAILGALILAKGTAAGQHGLSSSVISRVFEGPGRRTALGTFNFAGDLGKVCVPFLLALLINFWGWRKATFFLSLGGLLLGIFLWILTKNVQEPAPFIAAKDTAQVKSNSWGIKNLKSFAALLTIGIIDIATRTALLTFLPFLLLQKNIPADQVGFALTILFAGGAVGKFVCGVLAEWLGVIPMVIATEALTTAGILSLFWSSPTAIWMLLPLVGIVLNGTSSVLYATVAEIISPSGRSRGYGLYYAITLGAGAVSPIFYGIITDYFSLSVTIISTGLMALITIPLSNYLSPTKA